MAAIYDALGNYVGEDTTGSNGGTTTVVANPPNPPTTNTVPNTTTNTKKVVYQTAAKDSAVKPASDPSQFPQYDDNGNLMPGFKINDETGQPYYAGVGPATSNAAVDPGTGGEGFGLGIPDGNGGFVNAQGDPVDANGTPIAGVPPTTYSSPVNDPLAGLTPTQLQDLGGADPTDPYIRARLGIPQLPGSILNVTSGFGFGNLTTNFPSIDNALGTIRNLFSGTIGSLFSNTVASTTAATTGSGVAALVAPVTGPATSNSSVDPTTLEGYGIQASVDPTTLEGYGVQAAVDPTTLEGYGIQASVDPTTLEGFGVQAAVDPTTLEGYGVQASLQTRGISASSTTLDADQADAYYNGTGTLTADQRLALDQQTAADAVKLYPGSNNEALRQIDAAGGAIARNQVGISNAEQIIASNNAELANTNISDARRAELEANNASQENYIRLANDNTAENELVIEANADVYAAGGGNPDSGQGPNEVSALTDPAVAPVDPTTLEGFGVQEPVDPTTLEGYGIQAAVDPTTLEGYGIQATVDPTTTEGFGVQEPVDPTTLEGYGIQATVDPTTLEGYGLPTEAPAEVDMEGGGDGLGIGQGANNAVSADNEFIASTASQFEGSQQAAIVAQAKKQATVQARYKQPGNNDWRVRLSLGPGAKYLYNATPAGPLAPLAANGGTDGVIFPYTPSITTTYSANYEQYDLIHSNYRGLFYKNSRVGDIQLRGTFTAQNTTEANYLLAVIHFFRSVTKMFYGQDPERGTPPPICLLNGFGGYQFSDHPVVVSSFNYTLPNDVDYIRTTNPNNFGLDLNNRYNPSGSSLPAGGSLSGLYRLLNAIPGGLPKGAQPVVPSPNTVVGSVTNNTPASYVPTKMEIDVTLIPVQSRSQVSQQFSLKGFANGDLLKGGFW